MRNLHLFSPRVKHTESYFARVPVRLLSWHGTHIHTRPNTNMHTKPKASYGVIKVTRVMVKRVTYAISAGELEGVRRLTRQDKHHLVLVVPNLHVDSVVVFRSICLQFRAARGQGCPWHEYMNK